MDNLQIWIIVSCVLFIVLIFPLSGLIYLLKKMMKESSYRYDPEQDLDPAKYFSPITFSSGLVFSIVIMIILIYILGSQYYLFHNNLKTT